jgi:uncharacterized membrane protein
MGNVAPAIVAVIAGVIGLAIVAVLSKQAQTGTVITSAGTALSSIIGAAVSPVATGSGFGTSPTVGG